MSEFVHLNYLPKGELGRSRFAFFYFINKSKITTKCDCLQLFNIQLQGAQALSDVAGRANSTRQLKICLSQWNKIPLYSCTGHKMGGFKLVTFPCLEKLSHAQHSVLPGAVSPGVLVALPNCKSTRGKEQCQLKHTLKTSPNLSKFKNQQVSPMGRNSYFQLYVLAVLFLNNFSVVLNWLAACQKSWLALFSETSLNARSWEHCFLLFLLLLLF